MHGRPSSGLSARPGLTRPLCWRCITNMMTECRVLTASHAGPVSARPIGSRGVPADRRDRGQPRAFPRPAQRGHMIRPVSRDGIHGPGFRCPGSPMCSSRVIISCLHGRRARLRSKGPPSAAVPSASGSRRGARHLPAHPRGRPGELCWPAEHDLPDSSQYGDSSHPQRRMRAVQ